MAEPGRRMRIGVMFPGTNSNTVWRDPACGDFMDFGSITRFARAAERGTLDFVFFAEGLRLREQAGRVYEADLAGRPDNITVLAALAAVTDHIGLTGTVNSTFTEPFEVARQFASLDHLSAGRAGWNVVTSWDAFVGENFRRGGYLAEDRRYERAELFLDATMAILDSWREDTGPGGFRHVDDQFDIAGRFTVPRSPQGRPVVFQAGTSEQGKEFAAAKADAIFGMYSSVEQKKVFYADVKARLARYGRHRDSLLILPACLYAIGDTDAEAREKAIEVRRLQVDGRSAITFVEELWNRDLSGYDPDGPLPDVDPDLDGSVARDLASVRRYPDRMATAREWRARAEAGNLSIRDLVIDLTGWQTFIGSPTTIADRMEAMVTQRACDGFIMVPHTIPGAVEEFVDGVVPVLRERGLFRTDYEGPTLRDNLGLTHF